jgi:hypothetical protein
MPTPSPDAPRETSVYRPLPDGPSPRWRRAAAGLRWMRLALWAGLAVDVVAALARWTIMRGPIPVGQSSFPSLSSLSSGAGALSLAVDAGLAVGLWRFGEVPVAAASRPARTAFKFLATSLAIAALSLCLFRRTHFHDAAAMIALSALALVRLLALVGLRVAYLIALARALDAALRAAGADAPAWARRFVTAIIVWSFVSIPLESGLTMLLGFNGGLLAASLSLGAEAAFVAGLAALLARVEPALARQSSPEP